jgi:hypothetical protein
MGDKVEEQLTSEERFKIWWDEDEGIIRLVTIGKVDNEVTARIVQGLMEILDTRGGKTSLLVDLSRQTGFPSTGGRKLAAQLLKHPGLGKTAAVVTSVAIKVATNFIAGAAGYGDLKMCSTEEEALKWLKEAAQNG